MTVVEITDPTTAGGTNASTLGEGLPSQFHGIARRDAGVNAVLEVAIEVLVRIQLRRIGRQKEDLDAPYVQFS